MNGGLRKGRISLGPVDIRIDDDTFTRVSQEEYVAELDNIYSKLDVRSEEEHYNLDWDSISYNIFRNITIRREAEMMNEKRKETLNNIL